ncbi:UNVERIFIED_CONTAM: hypothetical protein GTU68_053447 [Idotea baltica]|nr:hypothetical protein [Idotea baltica]
MKRILVTGSKGQLGSELQVLAKTNHDFEFLFTDRTSLDISSQKDIDQVISEFKPDFLINAAAYTAVDKAESDLETAQLINATAVNKLADTCAKHKVWLIHISSDYVYHLLTEQPLREDYITSPKGVYAKTKLEGENALIDSTADFTIMRTSWVYSYFGHNFVKTMLRLGKTKDELTIVADQIGSPTYAKDIADTLLTMINVICESEEKKAFKGIFNYSNEGCTNWADFAEKIFEIENLSCEVRETTTEEYGAPAPRPKWSVLDKNRITKTFGINIIDWEVSLRHCLDRLRQDVEA